MSMKLLWLIGTVQAAIYQMAKFNFKSLLFPSKNKKQVD